MYLKTIQTDENKRELTAHGSAQFPLQINHDHLFSFYRHYVCCHWHEELEICVVQNGHVRYQLKEKTFELHPGDGLVINSCVPHSAESLSKEEPVMLTVILHPSLLYGTPASSIYQKLLHPYLNAADLAGLRIPAGSAALLQEIDAILDQKSFGYELRIKGMLCTLFCELLSPYEELLKKSAPSDGEALAQLALLLDTIHATYAEPLSLSRLAAQISLSREACCRFFKKMTGKTISEYLKDYRISQSILLLQDNSYSIEQVAQLVGFGNSGRFSAAFSERMSCTPRQYRQHLRSEP